MTPHSYVTEAVGDHGQIRHRCSRCGTGVYLYPAEDPGAELSFVQIGALACDEALELVKADVASFVLSE